MPVVLLLWPIQTFRAVGKDGNYVHFSFTHSNVWGRGSYYTKVSIYLPSHFCSCHSLWAILCSTTFSSLLLLQASLPSLKCVQTSSSSARKVLSLRLPLLHHLPKLTLLQGPVYMLTLPSPYTCSTLFRICYQFYSISQKSLHMPLFQLWSLTTFFLIVIIYSAFIDSFKNTCGAYSMCWCVPVF